MAPVRRAFSLRITEFSKLLRMFPLRVLVPVAAQLDLRLPSSGRPEQACSLPSDRALQDHTLSGASLCEAVGITSEAHRGRGQSARDDGQLAYETLPNC